MIFLLANTLFLILSLGYAWLVGSRLDRLAVVWIVAALAGTLVAGIFAAPGHATPIVLAVDTVLLAAITVIALRSERYWPTWFAGFHLAAVGFGIAALALPQVGVLRVFSGFWGVPALIVMVFGLLLDRRAEAAAARAPT